MKDALRSSNEDIPDAEKTPYQTLRKLYEEMSRDPDPDQETTKSVVFEDGSFIKIWKGYGVNGVLTVDMDGDISYDLLPGGITNIYVNSVKMQIGGLDMSLRSKSGAYVPPNGKDRQEITQVLTNWTLNSTNEGKIVKPPFKLTFPFQDKKSS